MSTGRTAGATRQERTTTTVTGHHFNGLKTAVLLGLLSAIILVIGGALGGSSGLFIALIFALGINGFSYFKSDTLALRAMQAYPVSEAEQPRLYAIVGELAKVNQMPMPRIYLSPTQQPNAFATGRNEAHAAVCCTEGIMAMMDDRELRGVLGHEISHVKNHDILIASVAGALASIIVFMASMARWAAIFGGFGGGNNDNRDNNFLAELLLIVLGPVAAAMIQMSISRSREYQADASGARVTGDPLALASALRKLEYGTQQRPLQQSEKLAPVSAMMIANPFRGGRIGRMFSTHPPMAERIARLEEMAGRSLSS